MRWPWNRRASEPACEVEATGGSGVPQACAAILSSLREDYERCVEQDGRRSA